MSRRLTVPLAMSVALACPVSAAQAQQCVPVHGFADGAAERGRIAEVGGRRPVTARLMNRPSVERARAARREGCEPSTVDPASPTITILPVSIRSIVNTGYPRDVNNGAAWAGRGATVVLDAGVELRWRALTATIAPTVVHQRNEDVAISLVHAPDLSPLAYPWQPIDWPQRHGWGSFWTLDAGQSRIAAAAFGVTGGVSTENLRWGPARRYPLLMSGTARGFPHAFLRPSAPLETPIGRFDAEAVWGRLAESDYFDADPANDYRLFGGFVAQLQPRGVPGLFLGFARAYVAPGAADLGPATYILAPLVGAGRDSPLTPLAPAHLRLIGLSARWVFPQSGFEAYAEWAMQGDWPGLDGFFRVPSRSRAFTLGLQKIAPAGEEHRVRVAGELTAIGLGSDALRNPRLDVASFYAGGGGRHGYTHRGQLLGAWVGPGSDAQYLAADLLAPWGRIGAFVERVRFDNDAYYRIWDPVFLTHGHDVELTGGLRQRVVRGDLALGWTLMYGERSSRGFVEHLGNYHEPRAEPNWSLELEATWRPPIRP